MKVIIDRFEGDFAVVEIENGKVINIPKILFPDACEGDIVEITINKEETDRRKKHIQDLINKTFTD